MNRPSQLHDRTYQIGRRDRRHGRRRGPDHRRGEHRGISIWLADETVSARHAELDVLNQRIFLRDLGSTNGTFLVRDGRLEPFSEGYVDLDQEIALGSYRTTIRDLIENA